MLPSNRAAITQVQRIFREQFAGAPVEDIDSLVEKLRNPFKKRFRTILHVAEDGRMIGALRLPTLVVQEGGYRTRTLGTNARMFFEGLSATALA